MQTLRANIDAVFLLGDQAARHQKEGDSLVEGISHVRQVLADIESIASVRVPSVKELQEGRRDQVTEEIDTATNVAALMRSCGLLEPPPRNVQDLCCVIQSLREREQQQDFHAGLLQDQRRLTAGLTAETSDPYTAENFAYGSTPLQTWLLLTTQPPVAHTIKQMQGTTGCTNPANAGCFTVFGSSSGSLVLFTALAYDISVQGVEILPFLHNEAKKLRSFTSVSTDRCKFVCADVLTASLATTRVLVLTSQCWDAKLYARVQRKLERELPDEALVIDYKDTLAHSECFSLLRQLESQRVSWSSTQPLFFLRKEKCSHAHG